MEGEEEEESRERIPRDLKRCQIGERRYVYLREGLLEWLRSRQGGPPNTRCQRCPLVWAFPLMPLTVLRGEFIYEVLQSSRTYPTLVYHEQERFVGAL